MATGEGQSAYPPELFRRQDESDDSLFYSAPRLVVHIDYEAIGAISAYFSEALPRDGVILDLMSSWRSHMPPDLPIRRLIGLGLNAVELDENPQLDERIVHDLNANPALPLDDCCLDAAVVTVSIQYMVKAGRGLPRGQPHPEARRGVSCNLLQSYVPDESRGNMAVAGRPPPRATHRVIFPELRRELRRLGGYPRLQHHARIAALLGPGVCRSCL